MHPRAVGLMRLILDTNVLVADFRLKSVPFRILRESAHRAGVYLCISQLVWDEALGNFSDRFAELEREFGKVANGLERISGWEVDNPLLGRLDAARAEYEMQLKALLAETAGTVLPYPDVLHGDIVRRILQRKKPFRGSERGYRDYLLWSIVIRELKSTGVDVHFVTSDRDFFNDSGLHDDLLADRTDAGIGHERLQIHRGLQSFVDAVISPGLERLERIKEELGAGRFEHFSLLDWAEEHLEDVMSEFEEIFNPVPGAGVYLHNFGNIKVTRVADVIRIPSGDLIIRAYFSFDARVTISASGSDSYEKREVREFFGPMSEDTFADAVLDTGGKVGLELILDHERWEVTGADVKWVESGFAWIYLEPGVKDKIRRSKPPSKHFG